MRKKVLPVIHIPRTAVVAGFIVLSGMVSLAMQTPTHALALDLGNTVTTVTNGIPIVNQITPVLAGTTSLTTTTPVTTATTAPAQLLTTGSTTAASTATDQATTTAATTTVLPASTQINQVKALQSATTGVAITIPVGLSAAAKQSQIAAAIHNDKTSGVTYGSRSLDPKVAMILFSIGIGALLAGLAIMFAVRPRTRPQLIET